MGVLLNHPFDVSDCPSGFTILSELGDPFVELPILLHEYNHPGVDRAWWTIRNIFKFEMLVYCGIVPFSIHSRLGICRHMHIFNPS